jgi:hypothetical protein
MAFNDGIDQLFAAAGDKSLHGAAGNAHPLPRFILSQPLAVAQAHGIEFIVFKEDAAQVPERGAGRLEYLGPGRPVWAGAISRLFGAWRQKQYLSANLVSVTTRPKNEDQFGITGRRPDF